MNTRKRAASGPDRYRCRYFYTRGCINWTWVNNSACAGCVTSRYYQEGIQNQRDLNAGMVPVHHMAGAMYGDKTSPQHSTIAALFSKCSSQFRKFYIGLGKDRRTHQISLSRLADEYGRFGVWGGNSGAERAGRGSLDERLRNDPSLNSILLDLLRNLYDDLERVTLMAIGGGIDDGAHVTSDKSLPVSQDQDSSSAQSSDTERSSGDNRGPRPRKNEMRRLVSVIYGQIQSLYKASLLLRRPDIHDTYILTASGNENVSDIAHLDKDRISGKMREWALDKGHQYKESIDAPNLVSRLVIANAKRREQLKFWQEHPGRPASIGADLAAPGLLRIGFAQSQPRQIESEPSARKSSESTKRRFPEVAKSVLDDNGASSGSSRTACGPSTYGGGRPLRLPDIPHPQPGRRTSDCPLCFSELQVGVMHERQEWKEHVFRDLRPYVCTFEQCLNSEKLYATRDDWLYHEMQIHRRRWVCASGCNSSFSTKVGLEQHMRERHEGTFAELQLPILLDICELPVEPEEMANCPLCPEASKLCNLQDHLATHLEDLALLILPTGEDDLVRGTGLAGADINLPDRHKTGDLGGSGAISGAGAGGTSTSLGARKPKQPLESKEASRISKSVMPPVYRAINLQGRPFGAGGVPQAPPQISVAAAVPMMDIRSSLPAPLQLPFPEPPPPLTSAKPMDMVLPIAMEDGLKWGGEKPLWQGSGYWDMSEQTSIPKLQATPGEIWEASRWSLDRPQNTSQGENLNQTLPTGPQGHSLEYPYGWRDVFGQSPTEERLLGDSAAVYASYGEEGIALHSTGFDRKIGTEARAGPVSGPSAPGTRARAAWVSCRVESCNKYGQPQPPCRLREHNEARHLMVRHKCTRAGCGASFSFRRDILRHMRDFHKDETPSGFPKKRSRTSPEGPQAHPLEPQPENSFGLGNLSIRERLPVEDAAVHLTETYEKGRTAPQAAAESFNREIGSGAIVRKAFDLGSGEAGNWDGSEAAEEWLPEI